MIKEFLGIIVLIALSSCQGPSCHYNIVGPDEFVTDSYVIRQGKMAVLEMMGQDIEPLSPSYMEEYQDTIAEDDVLDIALYHPTRSELREAFEYINKTVGGFKVTNGSITLPDIEEIEVIGLSLIQAQEKLRKEIRKDYKDADIFLSYKNRLQRKVELIGHVRVPEVPVDGKMRLFEVMTKSGMDPSSNLFMSYIIRDKKQLPIDLYRLINEGDMNQNIVMRGGDRIFIAHAADSVVMVMGEVNHPTAVNLPYGFITLPEAIVRAGGIPFTGDRRNIQIIRGDLTCPKIYVISWEHVVNLPNKSMLLIPGDTIFVTEKPITQWNRFISQLTPSFSGLFDTFAAYSLFNR